MIKYFSLPGYYQKYDILILFLTYYNNNEQFFYSDRIIDSLYDCPPNLIWNGGRNTSADLGIELESLFNFYRQFETIHLRHTFTNCLLTPELTKDEKCNEFVNDFIDPKDKIIINNEYLIQWFKQQYPNLELIYSTTINIKDTNYINNITKNNIYIMNYNYNNDNSYISKLRYPEHIEILCAEPCMPNCPNRMNHYKSVSEEVLGISHISVLDKCPIVNTHNFLTTNDILNLPTAVSNKRIEELSQMGIQYFKISGRQLPPLILLEFLLYYLVLPEYYQRVKEEILSKIKFIQFNI